MKASHYFRFSTTGLPGFRLLLPALLCLALEAQAQRGGQGFTQQFTNATVLLSTGDTIAGPLALHRSEDILTMTMSDNTVRTLPAVNVQSFAVQGERYNRQREQYYYDDFYAMRQGYYYGNPYFNSMPLPRRRERPDTALVRVFRTYRWNRDNDYSDFRTPGFFEQLSSGPVILLRREGLVQRPVTYNSPYDYGYGYGAPYGMGRPTAYYTEVKDSFFLGLPDGNVLPLRNTKKDLLSFFHSYSRQVEQYAKTNKLDFTDPRELAYIVNYANSLSGDKVKQ
ncbi:hypothetical protein HMJ29_16745 [Hymenobacter taeanensis]|uniref:DUF4136 domain-containing protein n=1 Tax=Hymenobacter taeanensis TaxID=2735321 RepID=A0A6M6BM11_9BACT|nr:MULTISPECIES: hypothetical protein [Hymenobacter]QJX48473.1 hypothetical protein HMJ29_16745 [Hymenobacter taeanensis]UOQ82032.1 hypothetical protein MUN83_04385 [Hymenobacter sp. 5414T-23]